MRNLMIVGAAAFLCLCTLPSDIKIKNSSSENSLATCGGGKCPVEMIEKLRNEPTPNTEETTSNPSTQPRPSQAVA